MRRGIHVITEKDAFVHVSGHPNRDELIQMYQHIRPKVAVPVHGETRHLDEHVRLAHECQVADAHVVENGAMVHLAPGESGILAHVPSGRMMLEGNRVVPLDGELMRSRQRTLYNGAAHVTVVLNGNGKVLSEPKLTTLGLLEEDEQEIRETVIDAAAAAVNRLPLKERRDDEKTQEAVRIAVRRAFRKVLSKKPVTTVHLVRI